MNEDMYPDAAAQIADWNQAQGITPKAAPVIVDDLDELDHLIMGAPPAVKFAEIGDTVTGRIVRVFGMQQSNFDTREPEWWDDGSPKIQVVLVLDTQDGKMSLYLGSKGLREAARDATQEVRAGFRPGGVVAVRYTGDGEPYKKGARPPKQYQMGYDPPGHKPLDVTNPRPPSVNTSQVVQDEAPPF